MKTQSPAAAAAGFRVGRWLGLSKMDLGGRYAMDHGSLAFIHIKIFCSADNAKRESLKQRMQR